MSRKHRIDYALTAVEDLEDARVWYADQHVPEVGERLVREVVAHADRLSEFPEMGRVVPEFADPRLREIVHPPFRIVCRLDDDRVRIVRVWRSERELDVPLETR